MKIKHISIKRVRCTGCHRGWEASRLMMSSVNVRHILVVQENYTMNSRKNNDTVKIVIMSSESLHCLSELHQNLLLVSWGGAPGFWKEEAASWSMGAEPGWLSDDKTRGWESGRVTQTWFSSQLTEITTWPERVNELMDGLINGRFL